MTVFDRIQTMSKDELQKFIYCVYLRGHSNEQCGIDDAHFFWHLLNRDASHVDNIINSIEGLKLYSIRVYPLNNEEPVYLCTKFIDEDDARQYILQNVKDAIRVTDTFYHGSDAFYKIMLCRLERGGEHQ